MTETEEKLELVESDILACGSKLQKMKSRVPLAIVVGIIFSFIFPFMPGHRGKEPLAEQWGYQNAVIFSATVLFIAYPIGYILRKERIEKKLRQLKLKKHLIKKGRLYK